MTTIVDALAALAAGDWESATTIAQRVAAEQSDQRLPEALAQYLSNLPAPGVYDEPGAFEAFIDNGGNVALYRQTIQHLSAIHAETQPRAVLDIGCGDGRVTAAVLSAATTRVDLIEPSAELLARAAAALDRPGLEVVAHRDDAATFFADSRDDTTWDIAQSTFALHTTNPAERPALLRTLARRTTRLLIVEFDVPAFADRSREHVTYLAQRYEQGIREYERHPEVISKFLMPVLVGQLDTTRARYTFEQPIAHWTQVLRDAGFTTSTQPIEHYWWTDAMLISATAPKS